MHAAFGRRLAPAPRSSGRRIVYAAPAGHAGRVPSEAWTWQLPPAGDEEGLEGYRVTDIWDRPVGSVRALLSLGDELYVVVRSRSLVNSAHRPIPVEDVAFADHGRCVVGLTLTREQFAHCPPLPRQSAVREGAADAIRVTDVPPLPAVTHVPARPATASPFAPTFLLSALGLLALLAIILFVTAPWDSWELSLFSIPLAFFLMALRLAYSGTELLGKN